MKQRIITAAILIAVFLPIAILGGVPFLILTYAMATIGLYELFQMRKLKLASMHGLIAIILLWVFLLPNKYFEVINVTELSKIELAFAAVLIFLSYTVIRKNQFTFEDAGFTLLSVLYVGIGFYYFVQTRDAGLIYLFYALFVVWVTDSGAYFIGRKFGKRKLWPDISPNKTVEGFFGGIISALAVAVLFALFSDIQISFVKLILMTIILSIFGQMGDLAESALKRHYGVKDSGNLFPGHGGILDRCDSWLFVLPLLNFLHILH
ncbi:phosphatidate cytidylyltransferase [Lederbergia citrea]|uniref:Phosphatidate cytidylyltransferase n=1 Tax=Lederbergia citrea TaxID=2833581 RepID=A0A942UL04_9BACI|nr:phosphatidate cytidylyltransferase [Lederbergia citrea]MBS4177090.1 phosphatidate cytidylyltransferase [Lederbergia citrea]MBS4203753.1 phosphatidate cytidylyltransferase [Lederbergia citrea]MBS4221662.1 phosphatidate cytidylyltransferase [Lederbergia citrea]